MSISEDKNPDEVVKIRRIQVTSENIDEVAKDIQMNPTELERRYKEWQVANVQLFIEVMEGSESGVSEVDND